MSESSWRQLITLAKRLGLAVWAEVFGAWGVTLATDLRVDGFKIHASDMADAALIRRVGAVGKPVLLAASGSSLGDIRVALSTLAEIGHHDVGLMVGFQAFPTTLTESHLRQIRFFREQFDVPVGYADHVDASNPLWAQALPLMAVAAGACLIEKHVTTDRTLKLTDSESALHPDEFRQMVQHLRTAQTVLGSEGFAATPETAAYASRMNKKLVATAAIPQGAVLTEDNTAFLRVEAPMRSASAEDVLGRRALVDLAPFEPVTLSTVEVKTAILVSARMDSRRLPGKALIPIRGRPLLARVLDRLTRCRRADVVVVCTTERRVDDPIVELAEREGVRWFRGSTDDVMSRFLQAAEREGADVIVRAAGDDLLTEPLYVDRAIEAHREQNADFTKVVGLPWGAEREVYSASALRKARGWLDDPRYAEYISVFVDNPHLFKVATVMAEARHRAAYRLTVDYPEDVRFMERLFEALDDGSGYLKLDEVIALLNRSPELVAVNAHHGTGPSPLPKGLTSAAWGATHV